MDSLSDSLVKSIENETIDVFKDIAEIGLDAFLEDGLIKQIPMLSTMVGIYKIERKISELHHLKQMMYFIYGIDIGLIDENEKRKYIQKFRGKSEKQRNKELEYIILITNRYLDDAKPQLLSKLYIAYVDGRIEWKQFVSYSEVLDRLLPGDVEELSNGRQSDIPDNEVTDSLLRLQSLGLVKAVSKDINTPLYPGNIRIPGNTIKDYCLTPFGETLRECLDLRS